MDEIKIFTPIGMLGYGLPEENFWTTLDEGVDAVICDSGSTDSGPFKLALGKPTSTRMGYERDLGLLVAACHKYKVPILIGSAGGDGSNSGVDLFLEIISELINKNNYRPMKVVSIYTQVDKGLIKSKLKQGLISPCGPVPELTVKDIDDATKIVAQVGQEPWLKAMAENPDFDIIVGGRSYDPCPYTAFCVHKGFPDLGINYHMGKIMECGAQCSVPKSREALATVRKDSFEVTPLNPESVCTKLSVAAHTLYEKTRPDILVGPGGELHLRDATYEELPDGRSVRVRGAKFINVEKGKYTLKLEGAKPDGFHAMCFGGIRDPILISQIDEWLEKAKKYVKSRIPSYEYELEYHIYGKNGIMGPLEPDPDFVPKEICITAQAKAATQDQATHVVHLARVFLMHGPYPEQRATAGNFAMPAAPLDIPLGPVSQFCVYHLMIVEDPLENFSAKCQVFGSPVMAVENGSLQTNGIHQNGTHQPAVTKNGVQNGTPPLTVRSNATIKPFDPTTTKSVLGKQPPAGHAFLGDLAKVVRSKNSGPYELTLDVMFADAATKEMVQKTDTLNVNTISKLYSVPVKDIVACLWWDPANAFKATIKRPKISGSFGELDAHGAQQHVPLLELPIPFATV